MGASKFHVREITKSVRLFLSVPAELVPCLRGFMPRVHPVRLLFNGLSFVLVESRQICGASWPVAGLPIYRRLA